MYSFQLYKFTITCFAYVCIMIPEKCLQTVKYNFLITILLLRQNTAPTKVNATTELYHKNFLFFT